MKAAIGAALLCSVSVLADDLAKRYAAPGSTFRYYKDAGCPSDASSNAYNDILLPSTNDDCISGTFDLPGWTTSADDDSVYVAYFTGDGIPESCTVATLQQANIAAGNCGTAIDVINGGTTGTCIQGKLPKKGGTAMCCGGTGNGCADVPSVGKRDVGNSTARRSAGEDVSNVKRDTKIADKTELQKSRHFQRLGKRDCKFTASGSPYVSRGSQQIVTSSLSCPGGSGAAACPITEGTTTTTGSSNSFGVSDSITAGGDFFVTLEDTVTFSYDYTYTESTTQSQSYTVNVPAGEQGYVTFTPTVSCVDGTFSGSCSWDVGTAGTACIPLYVSGTSGPAQGSFAFLQEQ